MGALKGSISYSLFFVDGEPPKGFSDSYMERIQEFRFQELTAEIEEDFTWGWTALGDMLDLDFNKTKVFRNEYLCLSMRMDKWSLPGALLKAKIQERGEAHMREFEKAKLLRSEKEQIRETVTREMKGMTLPSASLVDMVWNLEKGHVRFWTQSSTRVELFTELFESTFELRLVPTGPYVASLHVGLTDKETGMLADMEQSRFSDFG